MFENIIHEVETPCIVVNRNLMVENLRHMQQIADSNHVSLRPHVKTHKIPEYARLQISMGAQGITCAKVSEAEVMVEGGIDDIFLAYPQIGKFRIDRILTLASKTKRLIVGVDSIEGATQLSKAASLANKRIEVRLEIDTGVHRTGVPVEETIALGLKIASLQCLDLTGIYTFKSLVLNGESTDDNEAAGREEGQIMEMVARRLRTSGVNCKDVSAGSTPTGEAVAKTGLVTEIRPGTYIFNDFMLTKERWTTVDHIAVRMLATVVSVHDGKYAVIDGGTKTFPTDITPNISPYYYPGYAVVENRPNLTLSRMYEEHGIIACADGNLGLKVGDVLSLIPIHVCTAVNLQNHLYEYDGKAVRKIPVAARGRLV